MHHHLIASHDNCIYTGMYHHLCTGIYVAVKTRYILLNLIAVVLIQTLEF